MTTRRRNEFLAIESSDDEGSDAGYDSEKAEESKGRSRLAKKRKLSDDGTEDESGDDDEEQDDDDDEQEANDDVSEGDDEEDGQDGGHLEPSRSSTSKPAKPNLKPPRKNKTGVIYFSSLPPYLKPSALKSLLTARGFGPITKLFLSPAVAPASKPTGQQQPAKRNRRRMYTDGWVEFASKRTAKICAETLNATIVGGKKGGWYHDDIWNIRYLRGFKWADLMEQVQREKREADARHQTEGSRARKEEKMFLAGVEKGKVVEGIRKKREDKEKRDRPERDGADEAGVVEGSKRMCDVRRVFRQNEIRGTGDKKYSQEADEAIDPNVRRVLGKIF